MVSSLMFLQINWAVPLEKAENSLYISEQMNKKKQNEKSVPYR